MIFYKVFGRDRSLDNKLLDLEYESGDLFTNSRTTVILRAPVVRHLYRTICYSRYMAHLRLA